MIALWYTNNNINLTFIKLDAAYTDNEINANFQQKMLFTFK